jgi:hypothetical protein
LLNRGSKFAYSTVLADESRMTTTNPKFALALLFLPVVMRLHHTYANASQWALAVLQLPRTKTEKNLPVVLSREEVWSL